MVRNKSISAAAVAALLLISAHDGASAHDPNHTVASKCHENQEADHRHPGGWLEPPGACDAGVKEQFVTIYRDFLAKSNALRSSLRNDALKGADRQKVQQQLRDVESKLDALKIRNGEGLFQGLSPDQVRQGLSTPDFKSFIGRHEAMNPAFKKQ